MHDSTEYDARVALANSHYREIAARQRLAGQFATGFDTSRPRSWCAYGYPDQVTDPMCRLLYKRNGIARAVVDIIADGCWQTSPQLIQGDEFDNKRKETPAEAATRVLLTNAGFWQAMHEADKRMLVSGCSGLLFDFGKTSGALDSPVKGRRTLVSVLPVWKSGLNIAERDSFGRPTFWNVAIRHADGTTETSQRVHADRLVLIGDWDDGESLLEANYNDYVNLDKISGGSGESYLKNASRTIHLDYMSGKDAPRLEDVAKMHGVKPEDLQKAIDQTARDVNEGLDNVLVTQGATATPLVAAVPDPEPHYDVSLHNISARTQLPTRAIIGNQTGERASSEDNKILGRRFQGRRLRELSPICHRVALHLMQLRVIDAWGEFTVMWDDLTTPTLGERLADGKVMYEMNQGLDGATFTPDEIREVAGFDPLTTKPPVTEALDDDESQTLD